MTARIDHDCYPTPPDAVRALADWMPKTRLRFWLDPAAGPGELLRAFGSHARERYAIEVQPRFRGHLKQVAEWVEIDNALHRRWPLANVVANPPFDQLDAFVERCVDHARRNDVVAAVLARVGWIDDGTTKGRDRFRGAEDRPDYILRMPWRQRFRADKDGSDSTTHCWLVWWENRLGPTNTATTWWLDRPSSPEAPGAMAEDWARYQDRCAEVLGLVREAEAAEPRQEALL